MVINNISPSNYKEGIVRITQGWPYYHTKSGIKQRRHWGLDIVCGYGGKDDRAVCVEDSRVVEIRYGSRRKSGYVKLLGNHSKRIVVYKHFGNFEVDENDSVTAGDILATPNFTNTRALHMHLEVWNDESMSENLDPLDYLFNVQQDLKYGMSENYGVANYYKLNYFSIYQKLMENLDE